MHNSVKYTADFDKTYYQLYLYVGFNYVFKVYKVQHVTTVKIQKHTDKNRMSNK